MRISLCILTTVLLSAAAGAAAAQDSPRGGTADALHMTVLDVFRIASGDTVLNARIESGSLAVGDTICLDSGPGPLRVAGIERFNKLLDVASAGDTVGVLVGKLARNAVAPGGTVSRCGD